MNIGSSMTDKVVSIGGASGFWGDSAEGARQLIHYGKLDYLILDYLAEVTMSILARLKAKNADQGYAPDFVSHLIGPYATQIAQHGIKVVVNAGGLNPLGCATAVRNELERQGIQLRVAAVVGDDLMEQALSHRSSIHEIGTGSPLPERIHTANAYLGALPIARALGEGAQIVITGRCADSALVLGPLMHEFGWCSTDFDQLASGSLAGHLIECGAQCTGGFASDWEEFSSSWARIGFPIVECHADGSFEVTKPPGTGGGVTVGSVSEQITYETGDPTRYVLPDVVCDWSRISVSELAPDRVQVKGARGTPPTASYKVSATYQDGYRCLATLLVRGRQAVDKAKSVSNAILERTRLIFAREGLSDYEEVSVELIGAEDAYGAHARTRQTREVLLKLAVRHAQQEALEHFSREVFPVATSTVQGIAGVAGGRPKVQPVVRLFSFLWPKYEIDICVRIGDQEFGVDCAPSEISQDPSCIEPASETIAGAVKHGGTTCLLSKIAYARSGDKGDISNIAVFARKPEYLPLIREQLTSQAVRRYLSHLVQGRVERFDWPGLSAVNFLLHEALGGGGTASLRFDPQGKAHAEILLDFEIEVPDELLESGPSTFEDKGAIK